jgi:D-glycero-alpha-D-manno-heptose-7-phosphate kinase
MLRAVETSGEPNRDRHSVGPRFLTGAAMPDRKVVVSKTPFRVTFAGGGTDLPEYYRRFGPGACVSGSINKGIYIMVVENFVPSEIRVSYRITEDGRRSVDEIAHRSIREAMRLLQIPSGVQIITATQMPSRGTGIGSSSSCAVGVLNALHAWRGDRVGPRQLAREAVRIEREILREPGGIQDQYSAAYGGLNLIRVDREGAVSVQSLGLDHDGLDALNQHLMMFFTGVERSSSGIHTRQAAKIEEHLEEYRRMGELAVQTASVVERLDYNELGRMMDENWELKRRLTDGVTNPKIDRWHAAAKQSGALGGKLMGAGGGGFLFFVVPPEKQREVQRTLEGMGLQRKSMELDIDGSSIVFEE